MKLPRQNPNEFTEKLKARFNAIVQDSDKSPWKGIPVSLSTFISHPDHMNFPHITEKQLITLQAILHEDPLKLFLERKFETGVFCSGKGSGKDLIASLALCYVVYVLLMLKNPQHYLFGADIPGECIDLVNVAPSAEVASYVFFEKFKQRVIHWKWLRQHFKVRQSGKDLEVPDKLTPLNYVVIHPRDILFPGNIRCFSRHSDTNLSEGFNVLLGVMDEASAFNKPEEMYKMLKTSGKSRFPSAYRLLVLSFPRQTEDLDFTLQLVEAEKTDKSIFVLRGATWEILPAWKFPSGQTFPFEAEGRTLNVPIEYLREFQTDPETSLRMYAAIAPSVSQGAFFTFPDKITSCVDLTRQPIASYSDIIVKAETGDERIGKVLTRYNMPRQPDSTSYFAHIDHGLTRDAGTLCVGHKGGDEKVVVDLILEWLPDYTRKRPIDLANVTDILIDLKLHLINLVLVTADQFQSAQSIQALQNVGIQAEKFSVNKAVLGAVRSGFYSGQVNMLNDVTTVHQFKRLIDYGTKVAAPQKGKYITGDTKVSDPLKRDDRAYATAGVIFRLLGPKKKASEIPYGQKEPESQMEGDNSFAGLGTWLSLH